MMEKEEFNLSKKVVIGRFAPTNQSQYSYFKKEDVKEAVKRLKEKINKEILLEDNYSKWDCDSYQIFGEDLISEIDKLFGEELK